MSKLIVLIAIGYLTFSCDGNSAKGSGPNTSIDSLIDVVNVSPDKYKILLENEYVRVVKYSLRPGEKDNPHTHPRKSSYVISGGTLRVYPEGGEPIDFEELEGMAQWSEATHKHYVENIGKTTITILLTEIKAAR
ncbi:hypothetical protein BH10BAC4_BH10BAC4_19510 [soil metagenome]